MSGVRFGPVARWRAIGVLAVGLFLVLIARYWHPVYGFTSLLQLDASNDDLKIAAFREQPIYVYRDTGGYDGLYYAQIAYDPTLTSPDLAPAIDNLSYRARRILPSALAWLLAWGDPASIVHIYSLLNVAVWLILALALWQWLPVTDLRSWLAWAGVLFSAGALCSVRLALTDLCALALIVGSMRWAEKRRTTGAVAWLAAAALTRETSLLAHAGLWTRPWWSARNVRTAALATLPLVGWVGYIRWRTGPTEAGLGNFTWPFTGFALKWREAVLACVHQEDRGLAVASLLALVGLTVQLFILCRRARPEDAWWRLGAAYCGLCLFLGTAVWEGFPGAAHRVLLPLTLVFNVLACRTRLAFPWLILGNLSIGAGFLALLSVPTHERDVAALRSDGHAYVLRLEEGCSPAETAGRRLWSWVIAPRATLTVEAWPRTVTGGLRLDLELRGRESQHLQLMQGDQTLWSGMLAREATRISVPVQVTAGSAVLEFTTDGEGVPENDAPGSRRLHYALFNPRLRAAPPPGY